MNGQPNATHDAPRVFEVERDAEATHAAPGPQVIMTDRSERVTPSEPVTAPVTFRSPVRRRSRLVSLGLAGIALFFAGWLCIDAYLWIAAAFERSSVLGVLAAAAVVAGVAGAGIVIGREFASLARLTSVEAIQRRLSDNSENFRSTDARQTIAQVIAFVPKEKDVEIAIEVFQRQDQRHHTPAQQIDIFSRTVLAPLDRRGEAHVRTAVLRALGITAISPTALTDAVFFIACGVRMVRGIAASYGHRPTAAATAHLLRRLVLEAGKLGAVDIASSTLVQNLGGAVAERLASTAAESLYAAYRMARLGIIVMELCRPVPFRKGEIPNITSLVTNVLRHRSAETREPDRLT